MLNPVFYAFHTSGDGIMRTSRRVSTATLFAAILISGCANQNAVFRKRSVTGTDPTIFTMDAKQRNLLVVPGDPVPVAAKVDGTTEAAPPYGKWRICAEASPDTFSALSTSAGADLGFGQSGTQTEAKAKAALAIAEAAGTIERTQTINLLRESMYRTCERFMSGAIDKPTFVVQAGRDWRAMIAVLAIEQLTRAVRPSSTVLTPGGTAISITDPAEAVRKLQEAKDERTAAEAALKQINADAAKDCSTEPAEKKEECDKTKVKAAAGKADAEQRVKRAAEDVDDHRAALKLAAPETTAGTISGTSASGGGTNQISSGDIASVASTVQAIALKALNTNELELFCIQRLVNTKGVVEGTIDDRCAQLLSLSIGVEADTLSNSLREFKADIDIKTNALRGYLASDAEAKTRWPALIEGSGMKRTNAGEAAEAIADPISLDVALQRYQRLPEKYRNSIARTIGAIK